MSAPAWGHPRRWIGWGFAFLLIVLGVSLDTPVGADQTSQATKASRHTIENARTAWYVRAMRRWASRRASGKTVIHKRRPAKNPTKTAGPSWLIRTSPPVNHQRIG